MSVEQYLSTVYEHDCDYVDGVIEERPGGEFDHGSLQVAVAAYFFVRRKQWRLRVVVEQRVQIKPTLFRVPDVCVILEPGPFPQIIRIPPFICIEILSPEDRMVRVQKRIDDYLAFGVPNVWLLNPRSRRAFVCTGNGMLEIKDGVMRTDNPELVVPLAEVFALLD